MGQECLPGQVAGDGVADGFGEALFIGAGGIGHGGQEADGDPGPEPGQAAAAGEGAVGAADGDGDDRDLQLEGEGGEGALEVAELAVGRRIPGKADRRDGRDQAGPGARGGGPGKGV